MNKELGRDASQRVSRRRRSSRRKRISVILACGVLIATVSALVLPAITMEQQPICGLEEHIHGPECYREERVLICGYPPDSETVPESSVSAEIPAETLPPDITLPEEPTEVPAVLSDVPAPEEAEPAPTEAASDETVPLEGEPVQTESAPISDETGAIEAETEPISEEASPVPAETEPAEPEPASAEAEAASTEPTIHVHTDACYEIRRVLICGKQEHVHTDACYEKSDPYADTETPADWEASLSGVEKTGLWAEDLVQLAQTQLGYQESTKNFTRAEDGRKLGYSRYGAWYGSPYGDWCAMFLSFLLHYSGVPETAVPPQASCPTWVQQLRKLGILTDAAQPARGDLLFFDHDLDGLADHVGLVEALRDGLIDTIEGNAADAVERRQYTPGDPILLGLCPSGRVQQRLGATPEQETYTLSFEDDRLAVTLTIQGLPRLLPEDAVLQVMELTEQSDPALYREAKEKGEATLEENHQLSGFSLFDFRILSGDEEIPVPDTAKTSLQIHFKEALFDPALLAQGGAIQTLVLDEPQALPDAVPAAVPGPEPKARAEQRSDLTYESHGLSPIAVMVSTHTQQGKFWKVCRNLQSPDEFTSGSSYLVVSVEGGYALTNGNPNCTPVQLEPVKGNPDYYTIDQVPGNAIWTYRYTPGNGTRALYQTIQGGWNPVRSYLNPYNSYLFQTQSVNLGFEKSNNPACFGLYNGQYFLNCSGGGPSFLGSNTRWLYYNNSSYEYDRTSDMLILKQVDATLTIPDDAVASDGGTGEQGTAVKPEYDPYITPSDQITGSYENDAARVDYASDPATSQLEQWFGCHPLNGGNDFHAQKTDNGKVMADKSVLYGRDDYGAFPQYDDGTFGVTLSALGQAFVVDQSVTRVPLDVMFILDLSNSMNETDSDQSKSRAQILVDSINKTIDNLMRANPENRVGAVGYNSGAYDLLPLGHYEKDAQGLYFASSVGEYDDFGNPRIYIQATVPRSRPGPQVPCKAGTYTQLGIAQGYDLLLRSTPNPEDRTYTTTAGGQTVTRQRKPVVILVSDGEPTHCTNHYMDVLRSPYYGDGLAPVTNGKGIQGYYTILSANYYKRMVGIHYDNPAAMYTVAFGMQEKDTTVLEGSAATSHYRATVMNPTEENISYLDSIKTTHSSDVEKPLYQMLRGTYTEGPVSVGCSWDLIDSLGDPHSYVPVLKENPYRGDYAYADKAYLNNSGNDGLDAAFDEIIRLNTVYDFSYETQANQAVTLTDPIGEGMTVKGEPVLRVNGVNYSPTGHHTQGNETVYTYSGVVPMDPYSGRTVDLSAIYVSVETQGEAQTVHMKIPPLSLPSYTADPTLSYYYEALPIRLTYQVGLSPAAQAEIDSLQPGQAKTFYTNRHTDTAASGQLSPSRKNPYYQKSGWKLTNRKTANPTETAETSLIKSGTSRKVDFRLGNNGRLVITKKAPPLPPVEPVSVEKLWLSYDGQPMTSDLPEKVELKLYRTYLAEDGQTVREDVVERFTLSAANGWLRTFTPEELNAVPGRQYLYYAEELTQLPDYIISYRGDGILANTPDAPIEVCNRYRYGDVVLPATGGPGPGLYMTGGLLLMAAALVLYRLLQKRNEGRTDFTP